MGNPPPKKKSIKDTRKKKEKKLSIRMIRLYLELKHWRYKVSEIVLHIQGVFL